MAIDDRFLFSDDNFSSTMKNYRQRRELTHEQLSRLTKAIDPAGQGVSRVALSRYETGTSQPGLRELRLIALALRVSLSLLVYRERTDPMLPYKLDLEMRITDMVMDLVMADGLIKDGLENEPVSPEYLALVEKAKLG